MNRVIFILSLLLFPVVLIAQTTPRPAALILSNWKYQHLAPLLTPEADAALMRETLAAMDPAFDVTVVVNGTREQMMAAIEDFTAKQSGNPVVLVYASVHGLQAGNRNYLAPIDADLGDFERKARGLAETFVGAEQEELLGRLKESYARDHLVSVDDLIARLGRMSPAGDHVKMLFLDACRNPMPDVELLSVSKSVFGGKSTGGLARVTERAGVFVGMSAAANQVAQQSPGRLQPRSKYSEALRASGLERFLWDHYAGGGSAAEIVEGGLPPSLFTEHLAAQMRTGGSLDEVFNRTGQAVLEITQSLVRTGQIEEEQTPAKYSLLYREFSFGKSIRSITKGQPFRSAMDTIYVWVEQGAFSMGSSPADQDILMTPEAGGKELYKDGPAHSVRITDGYWIGAHEVTIRDYLRFLNESGQWNDEWLTLGDEKFSPIEKDGSAYRMRSGKGATWGDESQPIVMVSWDGAVAYCDWMSEREKSRLPPGYRFALPSEAEWEKAARGGTTTMTYAGDLKLIGLNNAPLLDKIAWYGGNSGLDHNSGLDSSNWPSKQYDHKSAGTHPVGLKTPNKLGAYDMIGNVFEWCSDWYGEDYYEDGIIDPTGPPSGPFRVFRGGGWVYSALLCRAASRGRAEPSARDYILGFRPALKSMPSK